MLKTKKTKSYTCYRLHSCINEENYYSGSLHIFYITTIANIACIYIITILDMIWLWWYGPPHAETHAQTPPHAQTPHAQTPHAQTHTLLLMTI